MPSTWRQASAAPYSRTPHSWFLDPSQSQLYRDFWVFSASVEPHVRFVTHSFWRSPPTKPTQTQQQKLHKCQQWHKWGWWERFSSWTTEYSMAATHEGDVFTWPGLLSRKENKRHPMFMVEGVLASIRERPCTKSYTVNRRKNRCNNVFPSSCPSESTAWSRSFGHWWQRKWKTQQEDCRDQGLVFRTNWPVCHTSLLWQLSWLNDVTAVRSRGLRLLK